MVARAAAKHPLGALGRMGFVAGMHVALLVVLANSFGFVSVPKIEITKGVIIDETRPREDPPPVDPHVQFTDATVRLVPPEPIPFDRTEGEVITPPQDLVIGDGEGEGGGSAAVVPDIVNVRADPRHPFSQPPYPPTDRREGNQGSVDVEIYVLANGRVGDARIVKSSGFERLDQVTLEEARRSWRMLPATRDGEPFAQWHRLRVVFKLRTQ